MVDKEGIAWGVILSLAVQGLYDTFYYMLIGRLWERWAAAMGVSLTLLFIFLIFFATGSLKEKKRHEKQDEGSEDEQKSEGKSQGRKWRKWLKKTQNIALILSILALGFTAVNTYRGWYPPPQRAKLTIFIDDPPIISKGTDNTLSFYISGKVVNDSPLTASIKTWDLFVAFNISYKTLTYSFNYDPKDLTISPSGQLNYTMGETFIGENNTAIHQNSILWCVASFTYKDSLGIQTAREELSFP